MSPAAVIGPLSVIIGAVIAVLGYRRATRVDDAVERKASIETQTGMAGLVIAGWQGIAEERRAERDQLRVELNACLERERQPTH